jgi:hypothetical protein
MRRSRNSMFWKVLLVLPKPEPEKCSNFVFVFGD